MKNTINKNQFRILTELLTSRLVELQILIGDEDNLNVEGQLYEALSEEYNDVSELLKQLSNAKRI